MQPITYHLIEHPFGYKVEYAQGQAVFTPREHVISTCLSRPLTFKRSFNNTYTLHPVDPTRQAEYIATFFAVFKQSIEFCGWSPAAVHATAVRNIEAYFTGQRGEPHPASVMALQADGSLAALALVVRNAQQRYELDLLYVMPECRQQGLASTLLNTIVQHLMQQSIHTLWSTWHICNQASRNWHHKMGFVDQYDWIYRRLKCAWYQREIWRHEQLGWHEPLPHLQAKLAIWQRREAVQRQKLQVDTEGGSKRLSQ